MSWSSQVAQDTAGAASDAGSFDLDQILLEAARAEMSDDERSPPAQARVPPSPAALLQQLDELPQSPAQAALSRIEQLATG
jgi:hypothetical protein